MARQDEQRNEIFELYESMTSEFVRVGKIVGEEGKMTERVSMGFINKGSWATSVNSINELIATQATEPQMDLPMTRRLALTPRVGR